MACSVHAMPPEEWPCVAMRLGLAYGGLSVQIAAAASAAAAAASANTGTVLLGGLPPLPRSVQPPDAAPRAASSMAAPRFRHARCGCSGMPEGLASACTCDFCAAGSCCLRMQRLSIGSLPNMEGDKLLLINQQESG